MFGLIVPLQSKNIYLSISLACKSENTSKRLKLHLGRLGYLFSRFRREASKRTDERLRTINEIIPAIRVIKMNAWEIPFSAATNQ